MVEIYGIKNCNTVKKALDWLKEHEIAYTFHDFKKEPAKEEKLTEWAEKVSWEQLVNKKGTTWRKLTKEEQDSVKDTSSAIRVLSVNNSMIKRPIIEYNNLVLLGFDDNIYLSTLKVPQ
ncbi:Spx/MgsR family RNA polymerase-binding regulatory protein [Sphingobacterium olei]|uniref:Spx/MgsR family RNA polymerase-binding regulatory protein n=1 Tax=Sphingobacterium olei TaxID=2571155 RepID=A0A4U0P9C7_9SPHI|nr:Spx/MgsR family RNA polymerase-binding regulatory protein [Sphingobacterium olei]TJZ63442.1 Spx/MgsR family RNA polymerase-binding regulatory protein [Sphingobacterium olei]